MHAPVQETDMHVDGPIFRIKLLRICDRMRKRDLMPASDLVTL